MQLSVGYLKPSHVATASAIVIPPVTGIDVASTVSTDIATVVANDVTNAIASAVATFILIGISNAIDIAVETVLVTISITDIATALDVAVDIVVDAILVHQMCLSRIVTSRTVSLMPSCMHKFRYMLSHSASLFPFPFDSLLNVGTQPPLPPLFCI